MQGGIINVELRLDAEGYIVNINRASQQMRAYQSQIAQTSKAVSAVERSHSTATQMLRSFVLTVASVKFAMRDLNETIFALPAAAIKASGEIERMTQLMKGLSKETTEAGKAAEAASNVNFVFDLAKKSPFEVAALTDSFVKLKSGGIDPTQGGLQALTDSVAKFGGSSEALKRASVAIQQMSGKGVISMEELRQQLGEAIPDAMAMMAEGSGQSMAEFTKNVSKGTVESSDAIDRMFTIMSIRNRNKALEMMGTWTGMLSQLKTEWTLTLNDIGQAGLSDAAKGGIKSLTDMLRSAEFREFSISVGASFGMMIESLTKAIKFAIEFRGEIISIAHYMLLAFGSAKLAPMLAKMGESLGKFYAGSLALIENYKLAKANESAYTAALVRKEFLQKQVTAAQEMQLLAVMAIARVKAETEVLLAQKQANMERKLMLKQQGLDAAFAAETQISSQRLTDARLKGMRGIELVDLEVSEAKRLARFETSMLKKMRTSERNHLFQMDIIRKEAIASTEAHSAQVTQAAVMSSISKKVIVDAGLSAVAIDKMGQAASRTTVLMGGLRLAFGFLVNPITLLMIAIEAGIAVWDRWGAAAKLAGERALIANNIKKGIASPDSVEASKKSLATTESEIATLVNDVATNARLHGSDGDQSGAAAFGLEKAKAIAKLQEKAAQDRKNIRDGETLVNKSENSQKVATVMDGLEDKTKTSRKVNEAKIAGYRKEIDDATMGVAGAQKTDKELDVLRNSIRKLDKEDNDKEIALIDGQIKYSENLIKVNAKAMEGLKAGSAKYEALKQSNLRSEDVITAANAKRTAAANLGDGIDRLSTPPRMFDKKDPNAKGAGAKNINQEKIDWFKKESDNIAILKSRFKGVLVEAKDYKEFEEQATEELQLALDSGEFDYKVKVKKGKKTITEEKRPDDVSEAAIALRSKKLAFTKQIQDAKAAIAQAKSDADGAASFLSNSALSAQSKSDSADDANMPSSVVTFRKNLEIERVKIAASIALLTNDKKALEEATLTQTRLNEEEKSGTIQKDLYARESKDYLNAQSEKLKGAQTYYMTQDQLRERDYRLEVEDVKKKALIGMLSDKDRVEMQEKLNVILEKMQAEHEFKMQTPLQKLTDSWKNATERMQDASTSWSNQTIDAIMSFTKTGKFEFGKLAESILSDILRIRMEQQMGGVVNGLIDGAIKMLGGSFGGGGGDLPEFVQANAGEEMGGGFFDSIKNVFGFANGGVMSGFGEVPMNYYANGGVAKSPQVAVFGEGRMNEAYVPLPDGRSIPVTLQGGQQGGNNVTVNVVNQTSQPVTAKQSEPRFDGKQMILDIVLTAAAQPGQFREGMKGALG